MADIGQHNVNVVDTSELLKKLLDNEHIPTDLREKYFALFSTSLKLTFLERDDIEEWFMPKYNIIAKLILQNLPNDDFDTDTRVILDQLEIEYKANLQRALRGFERITEATQINASTDHVPTVPKGDNMGFLARMAKGIGL